MLSIRYLYSRFFKKIIRSKSIRNSSIHVTTVINSGCSIVDSSIGKYSYCGYDCDIYKCTIGNYCSISDHVYIGGAEHPMNWVSTSPVFQNVKHSGPRRRFSRQDLPEPQLTIIGNDVWIGHGVSIKQGIHIGNGAVIATGAVVTKDVEPYSIVGGCPAKHIRFRFDQNTIAGLSALEWWNLSDNEIQKIAKYIKDPHIFIDELSKYKQIIK